MLRLPMNACMLAYTFYESDGRVIRYAKALAQAGASVDAIVLRRPGQPAEEQIDGVNVIRIQVREKNEKGKLAYLWRTLKFFVRSMVAVTRRHKNMKYDLIHVHSVPDFEVFATLFAKMGGAKIILDIHDIVPEFYVAKFGASPSSAAFRLLVRIERASTSFADHVIIANDLWKEKLIERSVPRRKCTSLLNYPDLDVFRSDLSTRGKDGRFLIVYPGSLNYHQGVDVAIAALRIVRDKGTEVEFEIYGEGPERDRLCQQIDELRLGSCIRIFDSRPMREIARIMANTDLGVVPKRNDGFGGNAFSTKILEFMALRVPIVVADTTVDKYYFDESCVRFFRAGDVDDLARKIIDAHRHRDVSAQMARNAYKCVEGANWGRKKEDYLALVEKLTTSK